MNKRQAPIRIVGPIPFETYGGKEFERLVYAYHARSDRWLSLEWFGQGGKDHGRDIVGVRMADGHPKGETTYILCANWKKLTFEKIRKDINRAITSPSGTPSRIRIICGHTVSAQLRDKAKAHAESKDIFMCELWSGTEFEEHVRATAESLLQRFCEGEVFPDAERELLLYAWGTVPVDDKERLELITRAFNRPAFQTPIWQESSLPAFRTAIEDTIRVLNTGVWLTREGNLIQRLPASRDILDKTARSHLNRAAKGLVALRTVFDEGVRDGSIEHCDCGDPECPTFTINDKTCRELTTTRDDAIRELKCARACCGLPGDWMDDGQT